MSTREGSQRGSRSHGTSTSSKSVASGRTSSSRTRETSRPQVAKKASRPPVRQTTQARRPAVTTTPFESILSSVWHWTKTCFTGEVPAALRASKIPSVEAHSRVKSRLRFTAGLFIILLGVLMGRIILLQTVMRADYFAASVDQRTRVNILRAARGVIFDRNGNELALSVPSTTVYADPRYITDIPSVARSLSVAMSHTPEQEAKLLAALSVPGAQFRYIARGMTKVEAQALLGLGLPGVFSYTEPSREVEGGVAGAVIGSTDPDGLGISGLEKQFNKILTGVDGKGIREVDKKGRSIAGVQSTTLAPVAGDDIVLTLDKNIQFQTDTALLDRVGRLSAKGGTAIVMNTTTGQVYAMSNVRRNAAGAAVLASGNFAAVESYEPGSVAKVFSISAALNEGKVTPETVLKVPGSIVVDDFPIRDAWPHGVIPMSVKEIVSESSNIGTLMTAEKIESKTLHDYLSAFGFGKATGLEYPGESRGILREANKWRGTEKVTVSYGYGMASTPLQMIAGVNTVANKGIYVATQLVSATIDKAGKRLPVAPSKTRVVLKPEVAASMTDMLREVICTGTGELAQVKGMQIAGKTGTGYKVQENGTYSTDTGGRKYFASFVGYFPAANPQVTMLVSIDEPDASSRDRFGGTAAATVFARLVPGIMHELGIQATGAGTGCKAGAASAGH